METGPPSYSEFTEAVNKCANNKGVNRDEILRENAPAARQVIMQDGEKGMDTDSRGEAN